MSKVTLLLLLTLPLGGQQNPAPSGGTVADVLWQDLQAVVWGAYLDDWQRAHPQTTCRQFQGDTYSGRADEEWTYRCQQHSEAYQAEWYFYTFGVEESPASQLEQFRAYAAGLSAAWLEEAHGVLAQNLTGRYGAGENPGRFLGEFGSAYWHKTLRWRTGDLEIYLYLNQAPGKPAPLELVARPQRLLEALAEDERLRDIEWGMHVEKTLDQKLANELHSTFPDLGGVLEQDRANQNQKDVYTALDRVLAAAKTAPIAQRPMLLLAADRLADHILVTEYPASPPLAGQLKQLADNGLTYMWNQLGGVWVYQRDLEWRVWHEYPMADWGEEAFVLLLNKGWDTSGFCAKGSDQFRAVIRQGEDFLAGRSNSSHRLEILFALGQAYETWWSLSRASAQDPYVQSAQYQEGAASAREKAIRYYDRVRQSAPNSLEATYAVRELPRLRLDIDTNQRRFFCIYD